MTEPAGVEPEPLAQGDDLTDNEFDELRRRFEQVMSQHPYDVVVLNTDPVISTDPLPELTVRKMSAFMQIPEELLHPPRHPVPRLSRLVRWSMRWWEFRDRIGLAWEALRHGREGIHSGCDYY